MSFWLIVLIVWAVVAVGSFLMLAWAAKHAPLIGPSHPEYEHRYDYGTRLPD